MISKLKQKNPNIELKSVYDTDFRMFGKVISASHFNQLVHELNQSVVPKQGNCYVAHDAQLASMVDCRFIEHHYFGDMRVQVGYVNGHNQKLNALEYHKSSEINVAVTDFVVLLGHVQDIENNTYETAKLKAFYVPQGTALEMYATTLHFSPFKVHDEGFKCAVILPYGTNTEFIDHKSLDVEEAHLLFKTNKWLIAHQEHQTFIDLGAHVGLQGKNIEINYK